MASKRVDSFRLYYGRQGNINITQLDVELIIKLNGNKIIHLNARNGRVEIDLCGYSTNITVSAINRFFELLDCRRFQVNLRKGMVVLSDLKTNSKTIINSRTPIMITLPIKSLIKYYFEAGIISNAMFGDSFYKNKKQEVAISYDESIGSLPSGEELPF